MKDFKPTPPPPGACDYWDRLGDDERQEILKQSSGSQKKEKIMDFAKYVDVADFEHFYLTSHAFRAFVDRVRKRE